MEMQFPEEGTLIKGEKNERLPENEIVNAEDELEAIPKVGAFDVLPHKSHLMPYGQSFPLCTEVESSLPAAPATY
jgi:hypothetical protein